MPSKRLDDAAFANIDWEEEAGGHTAGEQIQPATAGQIVERNLGCRRHVVAVNDELAHTETRRQSVKGTSVAADES